MSVAAEVYAAYRATRPSPEVAGSVPGALGTRPEGVWASRAFGCSAWAGAAHSAAAAAAAGSTPRITRVLIAGKASGVRRRAATDAPSRRIRPRGGRRVVLAPAHVGHEERAGGARV